MTTPTSAMEVSESSASEPMTGTRPGNFHLLSFALGTILGTLLMGLTLLAVRRPTPAPIALHPPPTLAPTLAPTPTPTPGPITVFVSGAVWQPGLYGLAMPARVGDALRLAGGLTNEADPVAVNQAELLWDGAQVHVPDLRTGLDGLPVQAPPPGVSGGSEAEQATAAAAGGLVDLNTASAAELEGVSGIGPSKAEAIIANRPYTSVDDLVRVPGIGAKTVEQLRDQVTAR